MLSHRHVTQPSRTGFAVPRWGLFFALCSMLFIAACSAGGKGSTAVATTSTPINSPTSAPVPTYSPSLHLTPVSGDFSVYVDPTFGYSFQYPSSWSVEPAPGTNESDVAIKEPIQDVNDPSYPNHPQTTLIVRATDDYQQTYVEQLLCNTGFDTTVDGFQAVDLTTFGIVGGNINKYGVGAPGYGRAFYAHNLAFEIWLQSSPKYNIQVFFDQEKTNWDRVLSTFNVGNGVKAVVNSC